MNSKPEFYNREQALRVIENCGLKKKHLETWVYKFASLRSSAKQRGVVCQLTLAQYVKLASRANLTNPNQIGQKSYQYQMGRIGDVGNYAPGNCRFITMAQNMIERTQNGGAAACAQKLTGRTKHNNASVQTVTEKISKDFVLRSPCGKQYRGRNLKEFAKKHSLDNSNLGKVCQGKQSHHKGWTGVYQ